MLKHCRGVCLEILSSTLLRRVSSYLEIKWDPSSSSLCTLLIAPCSSLGLELLGINEECSILGLAEVVGSGRTFQSKISCDFSQLSNCSLLCNALE